MNSKSPSDHFHIIFVVLAVIFSIGMAFLITYSYFEIFPLTLSPTTLTEPALLRDGYLPFNNIADQKTPLLQYMIAAMLPIFGGNAVLALRVLHSLLVFSIVAISLLWVYRVKGGWGLIASGVFFLAWSFAFGYWAALYYEFVLTPFYALALYFVVKSGDTQNQWSSIAFGFITGLAVLIKQQAILLCALMAVSLIWLGVSHKASISKLCKLTAGYLIGLLLPIGAFVLFFISAGGNIGELLYWTITINLNENYASLAKLAPTWKIVYSYLPSLILLPLFIWALFSKSSAKIPPRNYRFWLLVMFLSTLIYVYPRWSGRHLAAALPFLAVISGIACADLVHFPVKRGRDFAMLALYFGILIWWGSVAVKTYQVYNYYSRLDRFDAYSNFVDIAGRIKTTIPQEGKVALVPVDEGTMNLYYLLHRFPPSFMFFNYPWYMEERVIQRWMDSMEQDQPESVIYFPARGELDKVAPKMVEYLNQHYKVIKQLTWEGTPVLIMTLVP